MKINVNQVLNILIFLPLVKPVGLTYNNPRMNSFFQYWKLIATFLIIFTLVKNTKNLSKLLSGRHLLKKGVLGLFIFEVIYVLNTILRGIEFLDLLNNCITCIILMIYLFVISKSKRKEVVYRSIDIVFSFYLICQIVSMVLERLNIVLLKDEAGIPTYFFGPDNYSAFIVIPILGVLLYLGCKDSNKIKFRKKDLILLGSLTACYVWTGSVTAACALIILVVASLLINSNKRMAKLFSIKGLLILLILALLLILTVNIQNYFFVIFKLVGKGENGFSLNSRTYIWARAFQLIKKNPIFGIGNISETDISSFVLYGASHAHNIILELLLRTGIIGTISYLYFILYPLFKYRILFLQSKNAVLLLAVYVYLVLSFMDFYPLIQAPIFLVSFMYICADDMKNNVCVSKK